MSVSEALERRNRDGGRLRVIDPTKQPPSQPPAVVDAEPKLPERRRQVSEETLARDMAEIYIPISSEMKEQNGIVMFVGPHSGTGTSTVSHAFSTFMAGTINQRVLLIDGNCQKPHQRLRYGIHMDTDLNDVVHNDAALDTALYSIGNTGLSIASLFKSPTDRPFVASAQKMTALFETLKTRFDMVIIDCPSPFDAPEATMFARHVNGAVLVIEANHTNGRQGRRVKSIIETNGGKVVGMVFNKRRFFIPKWLYKLI